MAQLNPLNLANPSLIMVCKSFIWCRVNASTFPFVYSFISFEKLTLRNWNLEGRELLCNYSFKQAKQLRRELIAENYTVVHK